MKIVGCDLHTRYQQVAMLNAETGELLPRQSLRPHICRDVFPRFVIIVTICTRPVIGPVVTRCKVDTLA